MKPRTALFFLAPLAVASLLSAGCGVGKIGDAAARTQRANDLKQLGLLYHNYHDSFAKGPAGAADLTQLAAGDPGAQKALQGVNSGQYIILWGVKISDVSKMPGGTAATVLGYEASVPTAGGNVLMADGAVKHMTAEEFQKAPKANGT